jgi:hypothetical protein
MSRHTGMKWNSDSFSFTAFVDLMTPTLPDQREAGPLKRPYYLHSIDSREPLGHTATSNEVRLIDSVCGISSPA